MTLLILKVAKFDIFILSYFDLNASLMLCRKTEKLRNYGKTKFLATDSFKKNNVFVALKS